MKKVVMLPIEVPEGEFCWDGHEICEHFDNEGGYGHCDLDLGIIKQDRNSWLFGKPKECLILKS